MLYENVYIGSFIFAFGVRVGREKPDIPSSFNLFQQTPADKKLSDVFASLGGKFFLIEFKRSEKHILTELDKPSKNKLIEDLKNPNKDVYEKDRLVSKKTHFICYPTNNVNDTEYNIYPYYLIGIEENKEPILKFNFNEFVDKILDDKLVDDEFGSTEKDFESYLEYVYRFSEKDSAGVSGLLVSYNKSSKKIILSPYNSTKELCLSLNVKQSQQIKNEIKLTELKTAKSRGLKH